MDDFRPVFSQFNIRSPVPGPVGITAEGYFQSFFFNARCRFGDGFLVDGVDSGLANFKVNIRRQTEGHSCHRWGFDSRCGGLIKDMPEREQAEQANETKQPGEPTGGLADLFCGNIRRRGYLGFYRGAGEAAEKGGGAGEPQGFDEAIVEPAFQIFPWPDSSEAREV